MMKKKPTFEEMENRIRDLEEELAESRQSAHRDMVDLKRAKEALTESEEKYRRLVDSSFDGIVIHHEAEIVYINQTGAELLGASSPEHIIGKPVLDFVYEPEREAIIRRMQEVQRTGIGVNIDEERFLRLNGEMFYVEVAGVPVNYRGRSAIYVVFRDITKRKQAEAALRESEERYRNLFNNAQVGIFRSSISDGKILEVNRKAAEIYGYDTVEACLDDYIASEHYIDRGIRQRFLETLNKDGVINNAEAQLTRKDGSIYWGRFSSRMYADKGYLEGVLTDITEEKHAQDALREAYDIINKSPAVAFLWKNEEGWPVEFVSENVKSIFGYTAEEFVSGKVVFKDAIHPDDLERVRREIVGYSNEKGRTRFAHEPYRVITKNGDVKWIDDRTDIRRDEEGIITHYQGIVEDITEHKHTDEEKERLEDQLQRAYRMEAIGTLAGGIAHDFNNILSAIIGYTEIAISDVEKGSPVYGSMLQVLKAGDRAKNLVNQILTFSRQTDHELKPVQAEKITKEALKLLRASLPATIEIQSDLRSHSTIMADPTQIHQIIMNLCTNAAYSMREKGGLLEVRLEDIMLGRQDLATYPELGTGSYNKLTVTDNGHGMEPHILERIFDPFFTTKKKGEGTGMGLSVVHGIVKSGGGGIFVQSEPAKGTCFEILFPINETTQIQAHTEDAIIPGGFERILFIDDEKAIADLTQKQLESLGYEVTIRTSPIEALELFETHPDRFDIVITDMTMPKMTGKELSINLLRIRPEVPIILCTGFSANIDEDKAASVGIKALILKPILKREIADTIRKVLEGE